LAQDDRNGRKPTASGREAAVVDHARQGPAVREGIAASEIVVVGRGESQPLVPTADGVREPQNRRVEIVPG